MNQRLIILFSFFGHFLSGYLIYLLHERAKYLESRECVVEVRLIGVKNEQLR
jgi:hypothetical protein